MRRAILSPFALALLLGGGREARANLITLNPSAETYITENGDLGGPDSNHAGDALFILHPRHRPLFVAGSRDKRVSPIIDGADAERPRRAASCVRD